MLSDIYNDCVCFRFGDICVEKGDYSEFPGEFQYGFSVYCAVNAYVSVVCIYNAIVVIVAMYTVSCKKTA